MDESIRKLAVEVLEAVESRSPRALERARFLAEALLDGPPTNPAIPVAEVRRRAISTQTTVNQAEVFLGRLKAMHGYDEQVDLVKELIRNSFERAEASHRVREEGLKAEIETERARRIELEADALKESKVDMDLTRLRVASLKFARGQMSHNDFMKIVTEKEESNGS